MSNIYVQWRVFFWRDWSCWNDCHSVEVRYDKIIHWEYYNAVHWIGIGFLIAVGFGLAIIAVPLFVIVVCGIACFAREIARKLVKEQEKWCLVVIIAVFVAAISSEESSNLRRWGIAILVSVMLVDGMMGLKQNWKIWKEKRKKKLEYQKQSTERLLQ